MTSVLSCAYISTGFSAFLGCGCLAFWGKSLLFFPLLGSFCLVAVQRFFWFLFRTLGRRRQIFMATRVGRRRAQRRRRMRRRLSSVQPLARATGKAAVKGKAGAKGFLHTFLKETFYPGKPAAKSHGHAQKDQELLHALRKLYETSEAGETKKTGGQGCTGDQGSTNAKLSPAKGLVRGSCVEPPKVA